MTIAAFPDVQTASGIVTLLNLMILTFCGVQQTPEALPGFWIFMYRVSPFTYWVGGIISTQLHNRPVDCSADETSIFDPPVHQSCGEYLAPFLSHAPGVLQNPEDTEACRYCSLEVADQYLAGSRIFYTERWRNFGIMWAFVLFNIFITVVSYWAFRVKKWKAGGRKAKKALKEIQKP
jgi:ATP-binding cassette, subfamily G (WHITE), member 2, PDR